MDGDGVLGNAMHAAADRRHQAADVGRATGAAMPSPAIVRAAAFQRVLVEEQRTIERDQAGLPTYLINSGGAALMTIAFCLLLTIPAGYALARFPVPGKELIFVFLLLSLIVPHQSLLTPIFFMFAQLRLTNTLLGLAIVHTTIQISFSVYIMRNSFEAVPREIEEAAVIDGASSWQILAHVHLPAIRPAIVTVSLFAFITSWNEFLGALVIMNRGATFTLPLILANARQETSIGGTDWGMLQAGITISIIPCVLFYVLLQKILCFGIHERRDQMIFRILKR
jgi:multiple sugar transport system permease protein